MVGDGKTEKNDYKSIVMQKPWDFNWTKGSTNLLKVKMAVFFYQFKTWVGKEKNEMVEFNS